MSHIVDFLIGILGYIMRFCYMLTDNYGFSIILFTLLTKFVLFPVAIMTHNNAIRMTNMKPRLDEIKIQYIDDKDKYTDAQLALYKQFKYNPLIDILPLCLQIIIVLGIVGVVYRPLSFILGIDAAEIDRLNDWLTQTVGLTDAGNMYQLRIIEKLKEGFEAPSGVSYETIARIRGFSMEFFGIDLSRTPSFHGDYELLIIPALAGISAWVLCFAQNKINVLQLSQGKVNKIATTIFMVSFSSYFAVIVPCGVGLYWMFGNLFSILSMVAINTIKPPKKYVDYARIKEMQEQKRLKEEKFRKHLKREKADYKRFLENKDMQLMFYSEQNGFYKYFKGIIDYICSNSELTIHYVTSDPDDNIFNDERPQIKPYYVASERYLVPLFMRLEADMCVMTMPDLEKYHIKRSRVRKDVEYVYINHGIGSLISARKGSLDWFDTVLCTGIAKVEEIRALEKLDGVPEKLLVEAGYPLMDDMLKAYESRKHIANPKPQIIIAPSWQTDNIIELCGEQLLEALSKYDYKIILRPHPQHVRHEPERFSAMKKKYEEFANIEIQTDFSQTNPVMDSDILISDWSDIAWEFAFVTKRPVLFIDTPMKELNLDFHKTGIEPNNKTMRTQVGEVVSPENIDSIGEVIGKMLKEKESYKKRIEKVYKEQVFNIGHSSEICGRYIIKSLKARRKSA